MRQALHEHSTLIALIASIVIGTFVGVASQWSAIAVGLTTSVVLLLPRVFFGLKESRKVDKEPGREDIGPTVNAPYDMAGLASMEYRIDRAYSRATDHFDCAGRPPDPTEFRELAEE